MLRYAPPRLRAAKPSETLAPGAESTYNNNQPNGDLSELTKKRLPLAPLSAPPLLIFLHYEQFDSRYKNVLPLRRIYVPELIEDAGE